MIRLFGLAVLLVATAALGAQDPKPFALDKLDPAKLPVAVRPPKGAPKEVVAALGQRGDKVDCFAFRGDGRFLAVSGPDQFVRIWDLDGVKLVGSTKQPDSVVCVSFSADGKRFAVGDASGSVRIFEKAENKAPVLKHVLAAHKDGPVWSVAFGPDGKTLATGGRDKALRLWDVSKAKPGPGVTLDGYEDGVRAVAFDPDGKRLFSAGGTDEQLRVWELGGDKPKAGAVVKPGGRVVALAVAPDGTRLATAGSKGATKLWSVKSGKPDDEVTLETDRPVSSISFAPDGGAVAGVVRHSATEDRVFVWDTDGKKKHELKYDLHLHAVGFAPDGRHLVVVTEVQTFLVRLPR